MTSDAEIARYLTGILKMDPLVDPAGVLAVRRRALGLKAISEVEQENAHRQMELRRQGREFLKKLQGVFWTLPLDELHRLIDSFQVDQLPELRPTMMRVKLVANCRAQFPQLVSMPGMDKDLFNAFRSAAVLPAAEAGRVRESFLRTLTTDARLKKAIHATRQIQSAFPQLYQLEKDWFETIMRTRIDTSANNYRIDWD